MKNIATVIFNKKKREECEKEEGMNGQSGGPERA